MVKLLSYPTKKYRSRSVTCNFDQDRDQKFDMTHDGRIRPHERRIRSAKIDVMALKEPHTTYGSDPMCHWRE